ncbi:hypothetical protein [Halorubrum sp. Atlit-26R]|uniref:hypothetical protein n=1 Tax=Halorubrum sp. Atlit-26R TaxID=2282128 RepID=UPI000EF1D1F2|nr:hypothetical protein [Halorubrum sp. Atlit-26R]RLM62555.1 hypothetical protein DVK07_18590 [Halorubrum sp. Atlit-26R]
MPHNDESDESSVGQRRIYDALEAARRRRSDEELTVARLVGEAFTAIPATADLDAVRAAAREVLGDDRPRDRPNRSKTLATDGGRLHLKGVGDCPGAGDSETWGEARRNTDAAGDGGRR